LPREGTQAIGRSCEKSIAARNLVFALNEGEGGAIQKLVGRESKKKEVSERKQTGRVKTNREGARPMKKRGGN